MKGVCIVNCFQNISQYEDRTLKIRDKMQKHRKNIGQNLRDAHFDNMLFINIKNTGKYRQIEFIRIKNLCTSRKI